MFSRADMTIIYENEKKGSVGRVKHHLKEVKQEGNIFLIRGDEDYLEEVLTALGANRDHVVDVTTLAKPPANQSSSREAQEEDTRDVKCLDARTLVSGTVIRQQ